MMQIKDPIHGNIELDGMFAHIINTPEFQRLRSIEQGSFRPVFPGARHDRFIHSLGTYHLATAFAGHFFRNLEEDARIKLSDEAQKKLSDTFRYAALLHDVGHAPFSHTTENFFLEEEGESGLPKIWEDLCGAVAAVSPEEGRLFRAQTKKVGGAHEIASALILVRNLNRFTQGKEDLVNPALAARMVIGFRYGAGDLGADKDEHLGVCNCLISLLNSSVLDVDRLDYLGRDTQMSGYVNAPLDLPVLAQSVTALNEDGKLLSIAFRDDALRVFDLMFQAKVSHDIWVLAHPAGVYDAALRAHCIRKLGDDYLKTVFTPKALGPEGVDFGGRHYRYLSDEDIWTDLKAKTDPEFDELLTRELSGRRISAWRSYYEYRHLFHRNGSEEAGNEIKPVTADKVFEFVDPLLKYLDKNHILFFTPGVYAEIVRNGEEKVIRPAECLHKVLKDMQSDGAYSVALLKRENNHTTNQKIDPAQIRILFPRKKRLTTSPDGRKYATFAELTGTSLELVRTNAYFYLFRTGGLGSKQLQTLRDALHEAILEADK